MTSIRIRDHRSLALPRAPKTPTTVAQIRSNHYNQRAVRAERAENRIERRRRGEASLPRRRWKKGQGVYALARPDKWWSPFGEDGRLSDEVRETFHSVGALVE